ncbi:MAG: UDP-N-acetylmuramate dehydrogenase [Bacilli bacterium]|nr:UDP-N-acetylmuramate dehydrogenase [Bacilli bacterium]
MNNVGEVLNDVDLKNYTSLKIGGHAKYLVKPRNIGELQNLLEYIHENNMKYLVLGNGTNVILDDSDFNGIIIKLDYFKDIVFCENEVTVGSGVSLAFLSKTTLNNGFVSLGFASMIPGNVGGSVVGNAGCYGHEIMEFVKSVEVMDKNGEIFVIDRKDISYGYRYTSLKDKYIVLNVVFTLSKGDVNAAYEEIIQNNAKRMETQPLNYHNVGSVFRNPENASAGKMIDDLKLKGYTIGGAKVSDKHANFIINNDNASFKDFVDLINHVKKEVKDAYQIDLVVEPSIIKWDKL